VVAVDRDRFAVRLDQIEVTAQSRPRLVLVQALAKGDRDERAVELATEFGVDQVIAWQASRSVSRWSGSGAAEKSAKGLAKWAKIAREAAKQSMRARVPEVRQFVSTDELCDLVGAPGVIAAVLHPRADRTLTEWAEMCSHPEVEQVLMIVGPEGGLSDSEVAGLQRAGATSTVLGSHVLRTSSAGAAALAVLNVSLRRW
jgi:16S rRNA (uracil1498-N3)-methyltransferase